MTVASGLPNAVSAERERDFNRLRRAAEQIEFGMVGFNAGVISGVGAPFAGQQQRQALSSTLAQF
ncbi:hypothetical protein NG819_05160 [Pseudarthrobacter sp. Fe7]|nr:hypothetical protein NG819_05160 [Pseudarthrobacter sp. Fe7]